MHNKKLTFSSKYSKL